MVIINLIWEEQILETWLDLKRNLLQKTEYGTKLPNITNSIDVLNINTSAITDSIVNGINTNSIAVIPTDNLTRSFPFTFEPKRPLNLTSLPGKMKLMIKWNPPKKTPLTWAALKVQVRILHGKRKGCGASIISIALQTSLNHLKTSTPCQKHM